MFYILLLIALPMVFAYIGAICLCASILILFCINLHVDFVCGLANLKNDGPAIAWLCWTILYFPRDLCCKDETSDDDLENASPRQTPREQEKKHRFDDLESASDRQTTPRENRFMLWLYWMCNGVLFIWLPFHFRYVLKYPVPLSSPAHAVPKVLHQGLRFYTHPDWDLGLATVVDTLLDTIITTMNMTSFLPLGKH